MSSSNKSSDAPPVRVLIIEDESHLCKMVATRLSRAGCEVMTASEGGEGFQLLCTHHFDVVVSDVMMGPMDGLDFLDEVRRIWPWMGIVILSGHLDEKQAARRAELGVDSILQKPFSVVELQSAVFAEAARMREIIGGGQNVVVEHLRYQIRLLGESTRSAIEAVSLESALEQLALKLGQALPSIVTAIMCLPVADGPPILAASVREKISPAFMAKLEGLIRERYRKLSSREIPPEAALRVPEDQLTPHGMASFDTAVTFPLIDRGNMIGVLAVVPPAGYRCSESDTLFLFNAANHVTTMLMAFFRIRNVALRDPLTGLYNRHHLHDVFKSIWSMALRHGFFIGVMIIDVDNFKSINDTYGHRVGDLVLRELSGLARSAFRSFDRMVRYGGDELIVILPGPTSDCMDSLSQRFLDLVREHEFCDNAHVLHCTVSIGAVGVRLDTDCGIDRETLLVRAEEALYAAKRNGKDQYVVWSDRDPLGQPENHPPVVNMEHSEANPGVLLVDDDPMVVSVLGKLVAAAGFSPKTFTNGPDALAAAASPGAFQVALVDLNLGEKSGLELIRELNQVDPLLVKIVITGDATLDNAVKSLRYGAYDFLQKPVQSANLRWVLNRALEYHCLRVENRQYQQNLEVLVERKSRELTTALQRIRTAYDFTLHALSSMLDTREKSTGAHGRRVQEITCLLARDFGMNDRQLADVRQGALLHDIGKIGTPDSILLKQGPLTDEEQAVMREHVKAGCELIIRSPDLKGAAELMLCHHEAFDGSGYPRGLRGEQIPLGARIFTVVDAYDAMRSDRPYRQGMSRAAALAEITGHSGSQFDPGVVDVFLKHVDDIEKIGAWKPAEAEEANPGQRT